LTVIQLQLCRSVGLFHAATGAGAAPEGGTGVQEQENRIRELAVNWLELPYGRFHQGRELTAIELENF
jgi:hypothetical protein